MGSRKVIWSGSRSSSFVLTLFIFKRIFFLSFLFFLFLSCQCAFDLLRDDLYHSVYLINTTFPSRPKGATKQVTTHILQSPTGATLCSSPLQAMPIWIHVWSAAQDPFLCCRIQTSAFADRPFLILRVNVSRAGEGAFRRCLFEYMSQSIFFGPHTDSCLVWQTILFPMCMCHGQLCQEHLKRRSGDAYLNTSMICRAQSFFFGLIQTLAFSDRPFIKSRVYVSGAVE